MIPNWLKRTELLIGKEAINKIQKAKIIVYGIGGVGSYVVEGLVRAGIENIVLVDNDIIEETNINRQIHATVSNIGNKKTEVMKKRILDINPNIIIDTYMKNELEISEEKLIDETFEYIVDAVDTITTKIKLIERAKELNIPIISSMGTGNKLNPSLFEIVDISKTSVCPLAKVMRKELKKRNINKVKVLYSKEEPIKINSSTEASLYKVTPGSISFVPSVAGLLIASEIIKDIIENKQ